MEYARIRRRHAARATAGIATVVGIAALLVWWTLSFGTQGDAPPPQGSPAPHPSPVEERAPAARSPRRLAPIAAAPVPEQPAPVAAPPQTVAVRVRDSITRRPLPRAVARIVDAPAAPALTADADGVLVVERGARPDLRIVVAEASHIGATACLAPGAREQTVDLEPMALAREVVTIRGRVLEEDGSPAAAANVTAFNLGGSAIDGVAGGDGRFALDVPADSFSGTTVVATSGDRRAMARASIDRHARPRRAADIELRLGGAPAVTIRISGAADAAETFSLAASPRGGEEWSGASGTWTVRDGSSVVLPQGVLVLTLADSSGRPAAAGALVEADAGGVRSGDLPLGATSAVRRPAATGPAEVAFQVVRAERRVLVVDASTGEPVPDARVALEDPLHSDAWNLRVEEYGDETATLPGGFAATIGRGRRAPGFASRTETTDRAGVATFRGWAPSPAVVFVSGPYLVEHFETAELTGGAALRVAVVRGGAVRVVFPEASALHVVENVSAGVLAPVEPGAARVCVPAGSYRVRGLRAKGRTPDDAVVAAPVVVEAAKETVVDLAASDTAQPIRFRLANCPGAEAVYRGLIRDSGPPVRRSDTVFVLPARALARSPRGEVFWTDGTVTHAHLLALPGGPDHTVETDVTFEGGTVELQVDDVPAGSSIVLECAARVDAPFAVRHVAVATQAGGADVCRVAGLPGGTYSLQIVGASLRTTDPATVEVTAGATTRVRARMLDKSLTVRLRWDAPSAARDAWGIAYLVELRTESGSGSERPRAARPDSSGTVVFMNVPDGRYVVTVRQMSGPAGPSGMPPLVPIHHEAIRVADDARTSDVVMRRP